MPFAELTASLPRVLAQATGRRVVCRSDDPDGIETLGAYLAERGYLVRTVLSIPEAVAAVMLGGADLLLCEDSETAELGTQRLLARLQAGGRGGAPVPVLALSSSHHPEWLKALRMAGVDDVLVKPADPETVEVTIRSRLALADRLRAADARPVVSGARAGPEGHASEAVTSASWERLMNRLSFGLIMAAEGHVLFANAAARKLAQHAGVRLVDWARTESRSWMRAAESESDDEITGFRVLSPGSSPGAPDTAMFVVHMNLGPTEFGSDCFATLLFPSDLPSHGTDLMARALGLTPAETVVAGHLATGRKPEEIAHLVSVTLTTVNYHLRNIYLKSGTSRQSDTVRLLRSVPLAGPQTPARRS